VENAITPLFHNRCIMAENARVAPPGSQPPLLELLPARRAKPSIGAIFESIAQAEVQASLRPGTGLIPATIQSAIMGSPT